MTCNHKTSRPYRTQTHVPHFGNIVNELFNTAVGDVIQKSEKKLFTNPASNVIEHENRFSLAIALPGFSKDLIDIKIDEDILTISDTQESKDKNISANYRLREFNYSGFSKTYKLPEEANPVDITASFENGVLNIIIPKKEEAIPQPPRKITIK